MGSSPCPSCVGCVDVMKFHLSCFLVKVRHAVCKMQTIFANVLPTFTRCFPFHPKKAEMVDFWSYHSIKNVCQNELPMYLFPSPQQIRRYFFWLFLRESRLGWGLMDRLSEEDLTDWCSDRSAHNPTISSRQYGFQCLMDSYGFKHGWLYNLHISSLHKTNTN